MIFYKMVLLPLAIIVTGQSNAFNTAGYMQALYPEYKIINCAVPSSSIAEWQKGTENYNNCVVMTYQAINSGHEIVGIFHYQGEAETNSIENVNQYINLTTTFFNKFRVHIGKPGLRIVYAQLGAKPYGDSRPYWVNIQQLQTQLRDIDTSLVMVRTADIIPYCPEEGLHFCEAGYKKITNNAIRRIEDE